MNDPVNTEMGRRIAMVRKSHGYTQAKLAECLGIAPNQVSRIERAKSNFSLMHLIIFCRLFNCSLDYIVFGKDAAPALSLLPEHIVDILNKNRPDEIDRLIRYLNIYLEISDSGKGSII